jgi:hypothetical protein
VIVPSENPALFIDLFVRVAKKKSKKLFFDIDKFHSIYFKTIEEWVEPVV